MILLLLEEEEEEEEEEQKHDALAVFAAQVVVVVILCIYMCVRASGKPNAICNGEMCKTYLKLLRISRPLKKSSPQTLFFQKTRKRKKNEIILRSHMTCM